MGTPDLATSELVALPSTRLLGSGRAVESVHHPLPPLGNAVPAERNCYVRLPVNELRVALTGKYRPVAARI